MKRGRISGNARGVIYVCSSVIFIATGAPRMKTCDAIQTYAYRLQFLQSILPTDRRYKSCGINARVYKNPRAIFFALIARVVEQRM